jgi:hypothetical protein
VNETLYTEKLAWFKHNEKPEAVLVIADNLELIKIIIALSKTAFFNPSLTTFFDPPGDY